MVDYRKLGTAATVAITATVLYFLLVGISVDAMDGFVEADVAAGNMSSAFIIAYILAVYTIVLSGSVLVAARFVSNDVKAAAVAVLAGLLVVLVVSIFGLLSAGEPMSPDRWVFVPALFVARVLGDPNAFLLIEAACIGTAYVVLSIKPEVEN